MTNRICARIYGQMRSHMRQRPGHRAGIPAQDSLRALRPERLFVSTLDYPNPMWCMVRATWPLSITTPH